MRTLTKNGKRILAAARVRKEVAELSTGTYYKTFSTWVEQLREVLSKHGLVFWIEPYAPHNDDGRGTIYIGTEDDPERFEDVGSIWYSYHRMFVSGNWEIICYIS